MRERASVCVRPSCMPARVCPARPRTLACCPPPHALSLPSASSVPCNNNNTASFNPPSTEQYYSLDVSFFKSSLDAHLLGLLWDKYWVAALSSNPLLNTRDLLADQLADIGAGGRGRGGDEAGTRGDAMRRDACSGAGPGGAVHGRSLAELAAPHLTTTPASLPLPPPALQAASWRRWRARSARAGGWAALWAAPPPPPPARRVRARPAPGCCCSCRCCRCRCCHVCLCLCACAVAPACARHHPTACCPTLLRLTLRRAHCLPFQLTQRTASWRGWCGTPPAWRPSRSRAYPRR